MSIIDFFRDWIGISAGYEDIFIIFSCSFGLLIFDNLLRSLLGIVSSLFKKK